MFKGAAIFAGGAVFGLLAGLTGGLVAGFALGVKINEYESAAEKKTPLTYKAAQ